MHRGSIPYRCGGAGRAAGRTSGFGDGRRAGAAGRGAGRGVHEARDEQIHRRAVQAVGPAGVVEGDVRDAGTAGEGFGADQHIGLGRTHGGGVVRGWEAQGP